MLFLKFKKHKVKQLTRLYPAPGPITNDKAFTFLAAPIENPVLPP